jgi:cAMP phosphodiesterase
LEGDANLRPDIKVHTSIDRKKFDCLLVEVKCPKSTSDDDLFTLSIEMQYILNHLVKYGASNPVVYGVLVYGMRLNN